MTSHPTFGEKTEGEEVATTFAKEIKAKTSVGPNGLGAILARILATHSPALLILTGRSPTKVEAVTNDLATTYPNVKTRILQLDISSFESIRTAANEVNAYPEPSIDILVNNAGVMNIPERQLSANGFEMHLASNYLGPFLFTNKIMDKLINGGEGGGARIVNVSSNSYTFSPFRFSDYNFEGINVIESEYPSKALCEMYGIPWGPQYVPTAAYGQSKTALMLYSLHLSKLLAAKGVTTISLHPGAIATDLWRHIPKENTEQFFKILPMKTPSQGISTTLVAALDPKLAGSSGVYLEDCQRKEVTESGINASNAEKLWTLSEGLVKENFSF
ncbi:hypothetical protein G7Y89_g7286 [Cudoniella acicularis]|uniref:Short-chain dehydrogenase n=1 Tax=Cudoniella acicularis TaxID=354080 RepID=A0A8H4RL44_9HELO|nr:hypothetical protein G7Y89_g7286 [Cudoniella acicularis]